MPEGEFKRIVKGSPGLGCGAFLNEKEIVGNMVMIDRGNCSFFEKAMNAKKANASAVIIINNSSELFIPNAEDSEYRQVNLPVVIIGNEDAAVLLSRNGSQGTIYAPKYFAIDPNAIILTIISVTLIVLGSHWAVYAPAVVEFPPTTSEETQSQSFVFDAKTVLIYIITASIILVILYFLYQYVVYVVMAIFVIGAASGVYMCITSLMPCIKYLKDIPEGKSVNMPVLGTVTVKSTILTLISLALPVVWVIFRQTNNIWVLQDILGAALILGVLRTVHLPNLKIAVALLTVFFFL
jgi:signal peptide peptidase-like protein 2B